MFQTHDKNYMTMKIPNLNIMYKNAKSEFIKSLQQLGAVMESDLLCTKELAVAIYASCVTLNVIHATHLKLPLWPLRKRLLESLM